MFNQDIFTQRIKQLRIINKLKQEDIGNIINVSKAQISEIERGKKSTTLENLVLLADYFSVSLDYLTGRTDTPNYEKDSNRLTADTEKEKELLKNFRLLNSLEQNVILGKVSEIIYNNRFEEPEIEISEEFVNSKNLLNK